MEVLVSFVPVHLFLFKDSKLGICLRAVKRVGEDLLIWADNYYNAAAVAGPVTEPQYDVTVFFLNIR